MKLARRGELKTMKEMVDELKTQRVELEDAKEEYKSEMIKFDEDHKKLIEKKIELQKSMSDLVINIQTAALKEYKETENKKPYPGIGIRVIPKLEYDEGNAMAWAKKHDLALCLDKRAFENLAKTQPFDFVKIKDNPKVTISANL